MHSPGHARKGLFRGHPVWTVFVVVIMAVAVAVIIRAAAGSAAPASAGYNDPVQLAASVRQEASAKLAKQAPGMTIAKVICVHASGAAFVCDIALSDGTSVSDSVTVAADGNSWVSSPLWPTTASFRPGCGRRRCAARMAAGTPRPAS